ncbi:MAG: RNA polymerase II mediator complex subunit [Claussenomyces sp. TS43310]|nr:MAG: RNA polymerase II mediator complex subunit [Claussenomyces sp. TS43310]
MSAISDQFQLSLKAWPSKDDNTTALASLISRINVERGGFRNVTEASLQEEIRRDEQGVVVKDGGDNDEEDGEEEEPDRLKGLMTAREEMLGQLEQGHQASLVALDFVSLLLSKDTPVQASLSISPALRDTVSLGTLGADKVTESRVTRAQKQDIASITKGWKLQSLNEDADSILASAAKLEKEIEAETKYWQQIVEVSDKGWAVCCLPQERHTLGVRFGFSESAPAFRTRSLAALKRNGDGTIYLDQGIAESMPNRLRVRIQTNGTTTGQFVPPATVSDDAPILPLILRARNAIFEDELWQELNREGRVLANHGVRCLGEQITCPISATKRVILDLLPGEDGAMSHESGTGQDDDDIATMVSLSLHLLLSYAHHQIYQRRTQPQPPLSTRPPQSLPYNLLRPIITRIQHQSVTSMLVNTIASLSNALQSAGVTDDASRMERIHSDAATSTSRPSSEQYIERFISLLECQVFLPITSTPPQTLTIRFRTTLYHLETRFQISASGPISESCKPPPNPSSVDEVIAYVLWATACALVNSFADPGLEFEETPEKATGDSAFLTSGIKGWHKTHNPVVLRNVSTDERHSKEVMFAAIVSGDVPGLEKKGALGSTNSTAELKANCKVISHDESPEEYLGHRDQILRERWTSSETEQGTKKPLRQFLEEAVQWQTSPRRGVKNEV